MKNEKPTPPREASSAKAIAVAAVAAALGFAAVYGTLGRPDNNGSAPASANSEVTAQSGPGETPTAASPGASAAGKLAAFVVKKAPEALPAISFVDADGKEKSLSDFKGKAILLNLWATWCAPCREEMPSLDRLEKAMGTNKFEVVALALDRSGIDAARKFMDGIKVVNLKLYADATTKAGPALRVIGMPTTILVDAEGREVGRLTGPAEWDSADAKQLIEAHLKLN